MQILCWEAAFQETLASAVGLIQCILVILLLNTVLDSVSRQLTFSLPFSSVSTLCYHCTDFLFCRCSSVRPWLLMESVTLRPASCPRSLPSISRLVWRCLVSSSNAQALCTYLLKASKPILLFVRVIKFLCRLLSSLLSLLLPRS